MALYGAVPIMHGHSSKAHTAVLWLNAAETFVDVDDRTEGKLITSTIGKASHWISESGVIDVFLFAARTPAPVHQSYARVTGLPLLPPRWSIGYHQCRWNYRDEPDVYDVESQFDEHDMPMDVLWLDIEHTNGKRYFTWDSQHFPHPEEMQNKLAAHGRHMVTIVDPHIKRDSGYSVHSAAESKGFYIKTSGNDRDFDGWCWPGSVSYLDFLRQDVRQYWSDQFSLSSYGGSTQHLHIWNDMNEPSVFNGPEVTMPKDCLHDANTEHPVEHRDVHNQYGFYHHMATTQGLIARDSDIDARPFVLTRAFFAGSQRYSAVWTGDNKGDWSHLNAATPMLLSLNLGGIVFSGADVGGFFGNPDETLMLRWYQSALYQPFFRGHAHIDAKRREPYLFGEPWTTMIRAALRRRYAILPYLYTVFWQSSSTGAPIMRSIMYEFPTEQQGFTDDSSFLVGNALLVHPITDPAATTATFLLPGHGTVWYSTRDGSKWIGGQTVTMDAPLEWTPALQRGGTIIAERRRPRRASTLMNHDPLTLVIAVGHDGTATGQLYMDDGNTYAHTRGMYSLHQFDLIKSGSSSQLIHTRLSNKFEWDSSIERIVIQGGAFKSASYNGQQLELLQDGQTLVIRKPETNMAKDFVIELQ